MAAQLLAQADYADVFAPALVLQWQEGSQSVGYNWSAFNSKVAELFAAGELTEARTLLKAARDLGNYSSSYRERYAENLEILSAADAGLAAFIDNAWLVGTDGVDQLFGSAKNEMIVGGAGNDLLQGGLGNDEYRFEIGFGRDRLYDAGGNDRIVFGHGIAPEQIKLSRDLTAVYLTRLDENGNTTSDVIQIDNFFDFNGMTAEGQIETVRFTDGSAWTWQYMAEQLVPKPTEGNDQLYLNELDNTINALGGNDLVFAGNGNDTVYGGADNDTLYGDNGNDTLYGDEGDDLLHGGDGNDTLDGGAGNDQLYGSSGADILIGGEGNDTLIGGEGSDTYVFGRNFGQDIINNYDSSKNRQDTIQFTEGWKKGDFTYRRSGNNLLIQSKATTDKITVNDYFVSDANGGYQVDLITFQDGTQLSVIDIKDLVLVPTEQDDVLQAYATGSTLSGLGGNDQLYGSSGADILIGGEGNDQLNGGNGSDTYVFGRNFGQDSISNYDTSKNRQDTIQFTEGWEKDDFTYRRSGNNLLIQSKATADSITVSNYFTGDANGGYQVDLITFEDGTKLSVTDVKDLVLVPTEQDDVLQAYTTGSTLSGLGGNDQLYGSSGADILIGGEGNDQLNGGNGSDTYIFGRDFGKDTINNFDKSINRQDVIKFIDEWSQSDFTYRRSGNHLVIQSRVSADSITINHYFLGDAEGGYQTDLLVFEDGSQLTVDDIKHLVLVGTEQGDTLRAYETGSILKSFAGNDTLYGANGNDVLDGGIGDDRLEGGYGDDTLIGGEGNDTLIGGYGVDTYVFSANWGIDTITEYDKNNVIRFEGVNPNTLTLYRENGNLVIEQVGTSNQITISNQFVDGVSTTDITKITQIVFENGEIWDANTIKQKSLIGSANRDVLYGFVDDDVMYGADGDDRMYGGKGSDVLFGDGGDDWLQGGEGNDTLIGGEGNDTLYGDQGNDTYVFAANWGSDHIRDYDSNNTIRFEGILPSELQLYRENSSLIICQIGTENKITILNQLVDTDTGTNLITVYWSSGNPPFK